jgi:hypothetical protein
MMSAVASAIGGLAIFTLRVVNLSIIIIIAMALLRRSKHLPEAVEKLPIYLRDGQL